MNTKFTNCAYNEFIDTTTHINYKTEQKRLGTDFSYLKNKKRQAVVKCLAF